jgi:membrane-associated phospholipid phosphatase
MMKIIFSLLLVICFVFINVDFAESADSIEVAGDVGLVAIPVTAAIMTFVHNDKEGTIQLLEACSVSTAVTYGLKYTVHEKGPNGRHHSFPSGHSSLAFAGAAFIQQRYGWTYGIPAYLAASFVGYSRIESREHYFIDVLGGATIGIVSNLLFTKPYKGITVTPSVGRNFTGIIIGKSF